MVGVAFYWALAATLALIGSVLQCVHEVRGFLKGMPFIGPHNAIYREQWARIKTVIPAWRWRKRRRANRLLLQETRSTLSTSEMELSNQYDSRAWGWTFVTFAALFATVLAWIQFGAEVTA